MIRNLKRLGGRVDGGGGGPGGPACAQVTQSPSIDQQGSSGAKWQCPRRHGFSDSTVASADRPMTPGAARQGTLGGGTRWGLWPQPSPQHQQQSFLGQNTRTGGRALAMRRRSLRLWCQRGDARVKPNTSQGVGRAEGTQPQCSPLNATLDYKYLGSRDDATNPNMYNY